MQENQYDKGIVREYGAFSAGAWLVAKLESSSEDAFSNLSTKKEADEPNAESTKILRLHIEAGQPVRRGPTGPRTEVGKKRSSENALKFGIFSRATLLPDESLSEYKSLLEDLWVTRQPVGKVEEILVEKLASIIWRNRRMLVAEGAEIRKHSEFLETDRHCADEKQAQEISMRGQEGRLFEPSLEPVGLMWNIQNPDVLERCKELLVEIRHKIQTNGLSWERDSPILQQIYGDSRRPHLRPTLYDEYYGWFRTGLVTEIEQRTKGYATPEECKQEVLRRITSEMNYLKQYNDKSESIESKRMEIEILRQRVPDSPGLDRLLRYESSLERAFDRTLTQLERSQRMRKGQPLPPQLDVKIS